MLRVTGDTGEQFVQSLENDVRRAKLTQALRTGRISGGPYTGKLMMVQEMTREELAMFQRYLMERLEALGRREVS